MQKTGGKRRRGKLASPKKKRMITSFRRPNSKGEGKEMWQKERGGRGLC